MDDLRHEANRERLVRREVACSESQLAQEALVANDFGEACQGANVRCEADINFLPVVSNPVQK